MNKRLINLVFSLFLFAVMPALTPTAYAQAQAQEETVGYNINIDMYVDMESFVFEPGVYLVADVDNGIGYLINPNNGTITSFLLMSGQQKFVWYAGRGYYAATPKQTWYVKQKNIQRDRITFGPSGEFLRLFHNGNRTLYGIHGYKYFEQEMKKGTKYLSMGCLLVSDRDLDFIEEAYIANGHELKVITTSNVKVSTTF